MSKQALSYILNTNILSNERLKIYYDFDTGSVSIYQSGTYYIPYLKNTFPSFNSNKNHAEIYGLKNTGINTINSINYYITGQYGFLKNNGSGDLSSFPLVISGQPDFNLNDCSMLFNFSNKSYKDSILFGSLRVFEDTINNTKYRYSNGFNFGINSRGKLFFQSLGKDGDYIFVANSIELSKENIAGLSISENEIEIFRFDLLNQDIQSENFIVDANYIKNSDLLYLGTSPTYYNLQYPLQPKFDGFLGEMCVFSGRLAKEFLYNLSSGFISDYYYSGGIVTESNTITGYNTSIIYKTGVTGYLTGIIGYQQIQTGTPYITGATTLSGVRSVAEGGRYFTGYSAQGLPYKEEVGYLHPPNFGKYDPTGNNAFDTLGLQGGIIQVEVYTQVTGMKFDSITVPIYGTTALTGNTSEISGYVQTPLTGKVFETGAASSGIQLDSKSIEFFKKDYIYFLEKRL